MSRVAVMMSENHVKAQMSSHFGKAEWVMAADTESHTLAFLKNDVANGKSVVDLVASQGCTDAIFNGIGNGALAHLKATNVRGWVAPRISADNRHWRCSSIYGCNQRLPPPRDTAAKDAVAQNRLVPKLPRAATDHLQPHRDA